MATSETSAQEVGDVYRQTVSALGKLDRILAQMGADKTRLLSATVYIVDIDRKEEMDRAWCEWVGDDPDHWPQRACVEAGLYKSDLVEIVVTVAMPR
ncbi:MAG: Rid family hydrolase [Hyphomicrobiaceae bacterium]|nr:Rid family hydrolase [Hyphomicrobiaceae bacterium]